MNEVLILGNGISRKGQDDLVLSWPGEVWACNRAFTEYPEKITRLTGHAEVLTEAAEYKDQHPSSTFELWSGHLGKPADGAHRFTCPREFLRDSGTTLAAQALEEGRRIALLGFDLGGWDIHSPGLVGQDKTAWVTRWRELIARYGAERIRFLGHDHMPFLLSSKAPDKYAKRYTSGKPHIEAPEYIATWEQSTGKKHNPVPDPPVIVKVKFCNGYEGTLREEMAARLVKKGECVIVQDSAAKAHVERQQAPGRSSSEARKAPKRPTGPKVKD